MKEKQIADTKEFLQKAYANLPNDFSLREVRWSIYQALQKIELFETKRHKKQEEQTKQEKQREKLRKEGSIGMTLPWKFSDVTQAISIIDKMIAEEESKINVNKQTKQQVEPDNEDSQTFHG